MYVSILARTLLWSSLLPTRTSSPTVTDCFMARDKMADDGERPPAQSQPKTVEGSAPQVKRSVKKLSKERQTRKEKTRGWPSASKIEAKILTEFELNLDHPGGK